MAVFRPVFALLDCNRTAINCNLLEPGKGVSTFPRFAIRTKPHNKASIPGSRRGGLFLVQAGVEGKFRFASIDPPWHGLEPGESAEPRPSLRDFNAQK
jgi:hypothetical protein